MFVLQWMYSTEEVLWHLYYTIKIIVLCLHNTCTEQYAQFTYYLVVLYWSNSSIDVLYSIFRLQVMYYWYVCIDDLFRCEGVWCLWWPRHGTETNCGTTSGHAATAASLTRYDEYCSWVINSRLKLPFWFRKDK